MIINPEVCIDCGVCLPECPIGAIKGSTDEDAAWAAINAELAPTFKDNPKVTPRAPNDPPHKPTNKLVK
jgi:ferredoxin